MAIKERSEQAEKTRNCASSWEFVARCSWLRLDMAGRWPPRLAPIPATLAPMSTRRGWGEDGIFFEHAYASSPQPTSTRR
jgi:hypothetical protein